MYLSSHIPHHGYLRWMLSSWVTFSSAGVCMCDVLSSDEESSVTEAHECECKRVWEFQFVLFDFISSWTEPVQNGIRENSSLSIQCPKLTYFHTCLILHDLLMWFIYLVIHFYIWYIFIYSINCLCYIFYVCTHIFLIFL